MSRPARVASAGPRLAERARAARQGRRRALLRRAGLVLAVCAPFALACWLLLGSPVLAVQHIVVTGQTRLSIAQVEAAVDVREGTPLARVDTGRVARRVRGLGVVASVSVTRAWPHTLRVRVVERMPRVGVPQGGRLVLLDGEGVRLGTTPSLPRGVIRLEVARPSPDDPATRASLTVLRSLPPALASQLTAVRAASAEAVTLVLRGQREVLWGGTEDAAQKSSVALVLLKMKGRIFDVSSPGVVTRR